jgi:CheY-like chemotaxis protein
MTATYDSPILIRRADIDDATALRRLAQLDGARLPEGDLLVAEADGELRAALRVSDSAYVSDPFFPSKELVRFLDLRAMRVRRDEHTKTERARTRLGVWSALYNRALHLRPML